MTLAADPHMELSAPAEAHARPLSGKAASTDNVVEMILWMVPVVLLGLVLAVKTWGMVALTMFALPLVPLMFFFYIAISWP